MKSSIQFNKIVWMVQIYNAIVSLKVISVFNP